LLFHSAIYNKRASSSSFLPHIAKNFGVSFTLHRESIAITSVNTHKNASFLHTYPYTAKPQAKAHKTIDPNIQNPPNSVSSQRFEGGQFSRKIHAVMTKSPPAPKPRRKKAEHIIARFSIQNAIIRVPASEISRVFLKVKTRP